MSFFFSNVVQTETKKSNEVDVGIFHKLECKACPLNTSDCFNPKLKPWGSDNPMVYILTDFPTETDDSNGCILSGPEGNHILDMIPSEFDGQVRFNAIVRTQPGKKSIAFAETESCRPSIVRDILKTRPKAIVGLGQAVLNWFTGSTSLATWRGRRATLSLDGHSFYFYPVLHPTELLDRLANQKYQYGKDAQNHITEIDIQRVFDEVGSLPDPSPVDISTLYDGVECYEGGEGDLDAVLDFLAEAQFSGKDIGFDIETNNLRPYNKDAKILSMAFSSLGEQTVSVALDHKKARWSSGQRKELEVSLQEFFKSRSNKIVAHNLGFEQEWIAYFYGENILRAGDWGDTQAAAYVLDERYGGGMLKLDTLCKIYFGFDLKDQSDISVTDLDNDPLDKVLKYNALDAKYTVMLEALQLPELRKEKVENIYEEQVRRTAATVLTQLRGLDVDQAFVSSIYTKLEGTLKTIDDFVKATPEVKTFLQTFGHEFNIDSPHDINKLVVDILKSPNVKFTAKGNPSVDDEVLKKVGHDLTKKIIEHRETSKLKSTYIENLLATNPEGDIYPDGKSHPNINLMFTTTSRSSYRNPNWQNFPKKKNKELTRPALVAPAGHSFVAIDYGQIQARIIAMYSRDPVFVKSLWERLDVHQDWAERIAKKFPSAVSSDFSKESMKKFRDKVKNKWVFPSFFGAGKKSVAGYMNIPDYIIEPIFNEFWDEFSGVKKWQKSVNKFYYEHGYVEMLTGRKRHGPLMWQDMINHPVQGLEAEIVFDAYNRLSEKSQREDKPWMSPVLLVHDDLSFYIPTNIMDQALEEIITEMLTFNYSWINVPISLEVSYGKNWYETEPIGDFYSDKWNA